MIKVEKMKTAYPGGREFEAEKALLERGKITSVIGKNGSGKTTLLKAISGFMPYGGSILIDGRECRDYKSFERSKKVSYLPQLIRPAGMDVETLVEHGRFPWHGNFRRLSGKDREKVREALAIAHMEGYERRELRELSGGELRRAYLSMVIAQDADVMLLDEPVTYMDVESQKLFCDIIRKLSDDGHGIVMTCHNLEQAFSVSDQILIMEEGRLIATGTPAELAEDKETLRRVFNASVKRMDGEDLIYPYLIVK